MFGENIEEPSKNHLDTFNKGLTVTSVFRMRNGPFQIVHNGKKIFDQSLIGKANRFLLFAISSFSKIFYFCDLAEVAVVILVGFFLFCF